MQPSKTKLVLAILQIFQLHFANFLHKDRNNRLIKKLYINKRIQDPLKNIYSKYSNHIWV